jgi:hypothetical protein
MRSTIEVGLLIEARGAALVGVLLLPTVFLIPDAGQPVGKSFFKVAFESSWRNPGDLGAAWCSLKILLLSAGVIMLTHSLANVMEAFRKKALAVAVSFTALVPAFGLVLGFYELLKALL